MPDRPDLTQVDIGAAAPGPLRSGTLVAGRYRLDVPLASGAMATVWRASDTVLNRPVAVKVLHAHLAADPEFVARFRREAVAAARLTHSSIVAIYDTSADPESIIMELVEGRTLRDELDARGFLPPSEAVAVASGICQALEVAHQAGLVHRDVKPANVLLSVDGHLKVADFGIAKAARVLGEGPHDPDLPDLTLNGGMVGTPKYLAPEQVSGGDVDARADVYAVGAVLYEVLCGRPPFAGENDLAMATARLHGPPERPRSVLRTIPQRLDDIVMRAMERNPDDRYASAAALWADLQSAAGDDARATVAVSGTDGTVVGERLTFTQTERSWLVPTTIVAVVALALGLAWLLIGDTQARRELFDLVERVTPRAAEPDPVAVPVASAVAFDPEGDGSENNALVGAAFDGDASTRWQTERYRSRALGGLKPGVGLVLDLGGNVDVDDILIETPSSGWTVEIAVRDGTRTAREAWGAADAVVVGGTAGTTTVRVDATGSHVLVWITDLGDGAGVRFELAELTITGRR